MTETAIIIPHFNDADRLRLCLDALVPQTLVEGVETIIVDNGSETDLSWVTAEYPNVRLVTETTRGAAAARNRGVAESHAARLAFLDCDCVPAPDWVRTIQSLPAADEVIGGRIDLFDETPRPRSGAEAFEWVFAFNQERYIREKGFSVTANLITSRSVFERVGPFHAGLAEDWDWCHRATKQNVPLCYRPDLVVSHPTRSDWPALRKKWARLTEEGFGAWRNEGRARIAWALRAGVVLASGPGHLPRIAFASQNSLSERLAAAAILLRLRTLRAYWMLAQALFGATPR